MPGDTRTYPKEIEPEQLYQQICDSYRAIDDFRAKLLGFLPLVSGTGIFLLLGNPSNVLKGFMGPIGVFGSVITLGLFVYEIYGIEKCTALIQAGVRLESLRDEKQLESSVMYKGQFLSRPVGRYCQLHAKSVRLQAWKMLSSYTMDTDFIRQSSVTPSGSIIAFV